MDSQPTFVLAGVRMKQLLSSKETAGAFCLFENRSEGASQTPIHVHARDDETLFMLEGKMTALLAGERHSLGIGDSLFFSRGVPHQLMNISEAPAQYLRLCTSGGFEGFLDEGGRRLASDEIARPPTESEIERLKTAAPRFGITLLADWPSLAETDPVGDGGS